MMKTILKFSFYTAVVAIGATSCVKNIKDNTVRNDDFTNRSQVQFINAAVSATRNSIYVDGVPLNYATVAFGGQFPASPNVAFAVAPGIRSFQVRDTLITTTQTPVQFAQNFQFDRRYTIFLYDTINAAKQKTVQTDIVIPEDTTARVRFANFIFTKTAVPAVDIFSLKRNANVFTNVQITDVTNYVPYASALNDTLLVRETGTTNLLTQLNGFNPTKKRSYTLVFRGRYQTTTGTIGRTLSSYINY